MRGHESKRLDTNGIVQVIIQEGVVYRNEMQYYEDYSVELKSADASLLRQFSHNSGSQRERQSGLIFSKSTQEIWQS